jgi:4-amino-4-deoxy-L-arabinose transferase-like glycosyltransferase
MKKFLAHLGFLYSKENLILLVTIILAAILRLYRIQDYMTFLGDEGRDVLVAYNILHGHLTLLGPTSSVGGFFLGPIYYYFMSPFLLLFNYNPVGPAVMVALFGIATVWLIYKFCSDLFNNKIGIIAASLYAVSPLVIAYSRSSWNPNLMPFFTLLTLYVLYKAVFQNKLWLFFATGILYGILMQLHYIEVFVGAIIIVYVLLTARFTKNSLSSISKKYLAILIGFLIGLSPYIAFEARHGFPNTLNIVKFIFHSPDVGGSTNLFFTIGDVFFRIFARLLASFPPPEQLKMYDNNLLIVWGIGVISLGLFSFGYFLYRYFSLLKKRDEKHLQYLVILVWFVFGILLFGLYKKSIYDYYFEFMFPLPFILVGILLSNIYKIKKFKVLGKALAICIFIGLFALNIQGVPFRYPANRQLNQMETIAKFVNDKTGGKPFNFALITGGNSDHAYRYFFTIWGHPPITIQNAQNDPQGKTVTGQLLVVCESLPCKPLGNSLWEIAGFGQADIAGHWNVSVVEIYKLAHHKGK